MEGQAETNTAQIQIIDEHGNLKEDFKHKIKETDLVKFGKDYHIVSIIGNQSTGKSTLLNRVFGTTFDVMDASRVRKQTTKGFLFLYPNLFLTYPRYFDLSRFREKYHGA